MKWTFNSNAVEIGFCDGEKGNGKYLPLLLDETQVQSATRDKIYPTVFRSYRNFCSYSTFLQSNHNEQAKSYRAILSLTLRTEIN